MSLSPQNVRLPKLIVILGPTASGKSEWGLRLSKRVFGEIICADSRQIYKKMDIGTAKTKGEWKRNGLRKTYYVEDIPHHLVDFLDPGATFTVAEFRDRAVKYVKMAYKNGRMPIMVGGTGLYIASVVDNMSIPRVPPNKKLRQSLEEKSAEELFELLQKMDPAILTQIDRNNKRRLIRALEVCIMSGEPFSQQKKKGEPLFEVLQIGIDIDPEQLRERIELRIDGMVEAGLLREIELLLKQKYSWKLSSMSGIGYRQFKEYFEGTRTLEEAVALLKRDTRRFARRQMTWFRRDKTIRWCKTYDEAEKLIEEFLAK